MPGRQRDAVVLGFAAVLLATLTARSTAQEVADPRGTPEGAFREFVVARATQNEKKLREVILSADGIQWLLNGDRQVPPGEVDSFRKLVSEAKIRRLKGGDSYRGPDGTTFTIRPEQVGPDRAVLLLEGGTSATELRKVAGFWRVDARPFIAGRRRESTAKAATASNPLETPEGTFKELVVAIATQDEKTLRALILPTEGIEWLLKGRKVQPNELADFRRVVVDPMTFTRLKPGDQLALPGGKTIIIQPEQPDTERVVLLPKGSAVPTDFYKVAGAWKADARAFIAGRRAADAAKKKAEAAKK